MRLFSKNYFSQDHLIGIEITYNCKNISNAIICVDFINEKILLVERGLQVQDSEIFLVEQLINGKF
jgi:hypothetical protein